MAQLGQIDEQHISTLFEGVAESIDKIAEKVKKLVSNCSLKAPRTTMSFITQVLYEGIDIKGVSREERPFDDFFIDQVKKKIF